MNLQKSEAVRDAVEPLYEALLGAGHRGAAG
jgi:hypothetical protein